ncbi:MAG: hypothetical protein F6J93_01870 [Oscillatoria sp. SIO1A7]|nr:hypothetical protein [Oscillatoria sp. SIO1A7]
MNNNDDLRQMVERLVREEVRRRYLLKRQEEEEFYAELRSLKSQMTAFETRQKIDKKISLFRSIASIAQVLVPLLAPILLDGGLPVRTIEHLPIKEFKTLIEEHLPILDILFEIEEVPKQEPDLEKPPN